MKDMLATENFMQSIRGTYVGFFFFWNQRGGGSSNVEPIEVL